VNPASGKRECVFADIESVYPNGPNAEGEEFSFEELRARHRGLLDCNWSRVESSLLPKERKVEPESTCHLNLPLQGEASRAPVGNSTKAKDQTADRTTILNNSSGAKKARPDERANRTRKIHVMEVRAETQTSKGLFAIYLQLANPPSSNKFGLSGWSQIAKEKVGGADVDNSY
jgi:checkpoint serine/threonine-protein kinase